MEYATSPRWNTDNLNFDFIGEIFDAYINCPTGENIEEISDDLLKNNTARDTIHTLAKCNIVMTRRQIEVKIKHFIRALMPLTFSLNGVMDTLSNSDLEKYTNIPGTDNRYYLYEIVNSHTWVEIIAAILTATKNPAKYQRVLRILKDESEMVSGRLLKLRIGKDGRIRIFIPLYGRAKPTSLSAVVNIDDITFDKLIDAFNGEKFADFTPMAKEILFARCALFFNTQRIVLSGKRDEIEKEIYSYLLDHVIPNSSNPEWTNNYARDKANIKFTMKCTELMKTLPHFSTKDYMRGVMSVERSGNSYSVGLEGISFTEYKTSFGIHDALDKVMQDHCAGINFAFKYNLPERNSHDKQNALYLYTVFDFILPEIDYEPLTSIHKLELRTAVLHFLSLEMLKFKRRHMSQKRLKEEDHAYRSSSYNIAMIHDNADLFDFRSMVSLDNWHVGYLNKNDLKFSLLINHHDYKYATKDTPKHIFNIITNTVFWKYWVSVSTGEIYYLVDLLRLFSPHFIKQTIDRYLKKNNFIEYFNAILDAPLYQRLSVPLFTIEEKNKQYHGPVSIEIDKDTAHYMEVQRNRSTVKDINILTSEEFVTCYDPRKFLPPAIKRMMNINTAIVQLAGGQTGKNPPVLFNKSYKNPPKIDVGSTHFPLYTANAIDIQIRAHKTWKDALNDASVRTALHIALLNIAGNKIGSKLTIKGKLYYGSKIKEVCDMLLQNKNNIISTLNSVLTGNPYTVVMDILSGRRIAIDMGYSFKLGQIPKVASFMELPLHSWSDLGRGYSGSNELIAVDNTSANMLSTELAYIKSPYNYFDTLVLVEGELLTKFTNASFGTEKQLRQLNYVSFVLSLMFDRVFSSPTLTLNEKHSIESLCHPRYLNLTTFIEAESEKFVKLYAPQQDAVVKQVFTFMNLPKLKKELAAGLANILTENQEVLVLNNKEDFSNAGTIMKNCVGGRSYSNGNKNVFKMNKNGQVTSHFYVVINSPNYSERWCIDIQVKYDLLADDLSMRVYEGRGYDNRQTPSDLITNTIMKIATEVFNKYYVKYCRILTNRIISDVRISDDDKLKNIKQLGDKITNKFQKYYGVSSHASKIFQHACDNASESAKLDLLNLLSNRMFQTYMETIYILRHNKAASSVLRKHKFMDNMLSRIVNNLQFNNEKQEVV